MSLLFYLGEEGRGHACSALFVSMVASEETKLYDLVLVVELQEEGTHPKHAQPVLSPGDCTSCRRAHCVDGTVS